MTISSQDRFWINRLCIVGVGLIGGSLALALKQARVVGEVIGVARRPHTLQRALELQVIDRAEYTLAQAVAGADVVVIAVPLGAIYNILIEMAHHLHHDCIVTDVGSAKAQVVNDVRRAFGYFPHQFVPGHPIAGTEKSGVEAAFATLFQRRRVILTPLPETAPNAYHMVQRLWEATGATVTDMTVAHHDAVLAATSHLPHILAYCLVDTLAQLDDREEIFHYAAGGFRDFTRIASSDPTMWHDICVANREALLSTLAHFQRQLQNLTQAIENAESQALMSTFQRAKQARDRLSD